MAYLPIPTGPFTRSKVTRFTGLADEVIAHWTKEGLLRAISGDSGSGRHKEFDTIEVQKAAILSRMRSLGCGIDALRWFSEVIDIGRTIAVDLPTQRWGSFYKLGHVLRAYNRFLEGESVSYYVLEDGQGTRMTARSLDDILSDQLERHDFENGTAAVVKQLTLRHHDDVKYTQAALLFDYLSPEHILDKRVDGIWLAWSTPRGWRVYEDTDVNMSELRNPPLAGIMIYVTRTLRDLWSVVL